MKTLPKHYSEIRGFQKMHPLTQFLVHRNLTYFTKFDLILPKNNKYFFNPLVRPLTVVPNPKSLITRAKWK